nr:hypothetical protein [Streptomyces sp. SID4944]
MVFMGDRATLLETGRFVQRRGQETDEMADAAFAAVIAGAAGADETTGTVGHVDADAMHTAAVTGVT